MQTWNLALFVSEAVLYFVLMTTLLHFRHRIGLGVFLTALGVMHFVETYLAAVFYIELPFGVVSPGSSVFFAGKLMLILMLYIKEDASTVRQPIYGLFLGNLVTVAMAQLLLLHQTVEPTAAQAADMTFLREMGLLMIWGTTLLYVDSLGIILLYERLGRMMPRLPVARLWLSGALVLTFDQIGFFALLNYLFDTPPEVFWGGWRAKMVSLILYSAMFAIYHRLLRGGRVLHSRRPIRDVFSDLTFRERYEDLLSRTGRDVLTGVFDRSRMEIEAPRLLRESLKEDEPASLMIIDVDYFKSINDRFGHLRGDALLKEIAGCLQSTVRPQDHLFRFGGEEFVVMCPRTAYAEALLLGEKLCRTIRNQVNNPTGEAVTISLGIAAGPEDGGSFNSLLSLADERLYQAKNDGRNRIVGRPIAEA